MQATKIVNASPEPATTADWMAEATRVCKAAAAGDMEPRILVQPSDPRGFELVTSINQMLDLTDAFVRESAASLSYASRGKFFRRVLPNGMLGAFGRAVACINTATAAMSKQARNLKASELQREKLEADARNARTVADNLAEATAQIKSMSGVIEQIARQSTLLALNAAIEAARVGQAGAGFAVVAREVKTLAERTCEATKQIQASVTAMEKVSESTSAARDRILDAIKEPEGVPARAAA